MSACKQGEGRRALMGDLGFEEYFFSLMDGGFAATQMGRERGRCRQQQTSGVPGGLRTEANGGQIQREGTAQRGQPWVGGGGCSFQTKKSLEFQGNNNRTESSNIFSSYSWL